MRQLVKRLVSAKFFFAKFAIKLVPKNGPQEASLIFFGIILNYRIFDIWGKGRGEIIWGREDDRVDRGSDLREGQERTG